MTKYFATHLNGVTVALVLILFGNVCVSYAINCDDLWDDESNAEMHMDNELYNKEQQQFSGGRANDDNDTPESKEFDDEEDDVDETGQAFVLHFGKRHHNEESAEEEGGSHHGSRHKRQLASPAEEAVGAGVEDPIDDLETAETHLFRPVFRYKSQYTERRRVRDNLAPSRP